MRTLIFIWMLLLSVSSYGQAQEIESYKRAVFHLLEADSILPSQKKKGPCSILHTPTKSQKVCSDIAQHIIESSANSLWEYSGQKNREGLKSPLVTYENRSLRGTPESTSIPKGKELLFYKHVYKELTYFLDKKSKWPLYGSIGFNAFGVACSVATAAVSVASTVGLLPFGGLGALNIPIAAVSLGVGLVNLAFLGKSIHKLIKVRQYNKMIKTVPALVVSED